MKNKNKIASLLTPLHIGWGWVLFLLLTACQDNYDNGTTAQLSNESISFVGSVSSSRQATRADNTLINKGETSLKPTSESGQKVGLFAAYTGQYAWAQLVDAYNDAFTDFKGGDDTKTVDDFQASDAFRTFAATAQGKAYTANEMYNVPAEIASDGTLSYSPLRFWPNNVLTSGAKAGEHEYMTFWGYYPYNPTSSMGSYGIAITDDVQGQGMGMGRVKFTMHPDASQQNDFLISAPVTDGNRDSYVLRRTDNTPTYEPTPVQLRLYHMLAQVRFYVFINGNDKMVYQADPCTQAMLDTWDGTKFTDSHLENNATKKDFSGVDKPAVMNDLGEWVELHVGDKIPDESQCVRWQRSSIYNLSGTSRRPEITYTMEMNNIRTSATFYPKYGTNTTIAYDEATTLGSATINHYIMNPYWFTFKNGLRDRLNDNYMFGYYEDTPVAHQYNATNQTTLDAAAGSGTYSDYDGWNWTSLDDPLDYLRTRDSDFKNELKGMGDNASKHYNFAPGNILLVVPQTLSDDDVPHVVITAHGKQVDNNNTVKTDGSGNDIELTAKVTVNLLKMGISWESGFIYCYAFLDELRPGDDKVRGPESITVLFNSNWYTDQW